MCVCVCVSVCAGSEMFADSQSMACEGELFPDWSFNTNK